MRHGHLLHQEKPLDNLGYFDGGDVDAVVDEKIEPKLFFEDAQGRVVGVDGVVKKTGSIPPGVPTAGVQLQQSRNTYQQQQQSQQQQQNKSARPKMGVSTVALSTPILTTVPPSSSASASGGAAGKKDLPKIKLNLQQLQQLLGDKKSGLQKNAQGQLILKMPNKDIGQISEKLKMLTSQQREQLEQQL